MFKLFKSLKRTIMTYIYLIDAVTMNQTVFNKWYHFNSMSDQSHTKY